MEKHFNVLKFVETK